MAGGLFISISLYLANLKVRASDFLETLPVLRRLVGK